MDAVLHMKATPDEHRLLLGACDCYIDWLKERAGLAVKVPLEPTPRDRKEAREELAKMLSLRTKL